MKLTENRFGVWLGSERVGTLNQRGDHVWFTLDPDYIANPRRHILGLIFENDPQAPHSSHMKLPPWFSNLLPEGRLREWVAHDRGVKPSREMELLAHVGHDLPGAVRVLAEDEPPDSFPEPPLTGRTGTAMEGEPKWRFSLAGVTLKFIMVETHGGLTLPAFGEGGDWIVKLPDARFEGVPVNEFTMMKLASAVGIEVPEIRLIHRSELPTLPDRAWPSSEEFAFAVRRFDRQGGRREAIHIEDFAQVRNFYPENEGKYLGEFETVGSFCYRGSDLPSLQEFVRRITYNITISNNDAHLKNWSLIYRDPRNPSLSPAYDLVSTAAYAEDRAIRDDMGLKFGGNRDMARQRVTSFSRLQEKLGVESVDLLDCALETLRRIQDEWPFVAPLLDDLPRVQGAIDDSIRARAESLIRC